MILLPASDFTLDELTRAYNQSRTDYLIPMPMNPDRLNEYITLYDVDLHSSRVAVVGENIVGLGMLGRRQDQSWVTRLGVLPEGRRQGIGRAILLGLEVLVAADIIRTVAVDPTFESLGVLALIVAIRTFLSFSLEVELEGRWPWQRAAVPPAGKGDPQA